MPEGIFFCFDRHCLVGNIVCRFLPCLLSLSHPVSLVLTNYLWGEVELYPGNIINHKN